ncbi:hypothetical protein FA95DRAFT_1298074 [Auriscalpium vulgare]|uniref:Uncharacterized protein n=1 Tax=Auriscalpium vulgare TaxID=40419 RepID=A0ACB8R2C9_9AGAM|nr:hypothetical protein FA95DRAFT_1298074 [Auriscalpium vulgare]
MLTTVSVGFAGRGASLPIYSPPESCLRKPQITTRATEGQKGYADIDVSDFSAPLFCSELTRIRSGAPRPRARKTSSRPSGSSKGAPHCNL